jgi:hypothetical protein
MRHTFIAVTLSLLAACSALDFLGPNRALETKSGDVEHFVQQQQLPKVQQIETRLHVPEHELMLFKVVFGDPVRDNMPCIGECPPAYPRAWGLKYGTTIGWLLGPFDDLKRYRFFTTGPEDHYLFTAEFFGKLAAAEVLLFEQTFKPMLARSSATPSEALLLITEGLYTWINPPLAELLLENPKVRASRDMLVLIANLPIFQGDAYREVRAKAQALLRQLNHE